MCFDSVDIHLLSPLTVSSEAESQYQSVSNTDVWVQLPKHVGGQPPSK